MNRQVWLSTIIAITFTALFSLPAQAAVRRQTLRDHLALILRDTFLPVASPV